jgi:hypothetical protein
MAMVSANVAIRRRCSGVKPDRCEFAQKSLEGLLDLDELHPAHECRSFPGTHEARRLVAP